MHQRGHPFAWVRIGQHDCAFRVFGGELAERFEHHAQMVYGSHVSVDDRRAAGHEPTEVIAEEREMRAAEHHGINRLEVISVKIPVQRAFDQLAVVKLPVLHDFHQCRARLFVNDVG